MITYTTSDMVLGTKKADAYLTIHVFTDFLCSACNKFKSYTPYFAKKYKKDIRIIFHHYPLDKDCNTGMRRSLHPGACKMHKAFHAATKMGYFKQMATIHLKNFFKYYGKLRDDYTDFAIDEFIAEMKFTPQEKNKFYKIMGSNQTYKAIMKDIQLSKDLKIRSTPTMFFNNRRVVGVMGRPYMEAIIKTEIEGKGQY